VPRNALGAACDSSTTARRPSHRSLWPAMMGVARKSRRRRWLFNSEWSGIGDFQTCAGFVGSWRICPSDEAQAHAGTGGRKSSRPRLDGVKRSIDVLSRHRDTSITCPTRHSRLTLGWAVVTMLHWVCRIPQKSRSYWMERVLRRSSTCARVRHKPSDAPGAGGGPGTYAG
jgi:hypothetical protein